MEQQNNVDNFNTMRSSSEGYSIKEIWKLLETALKKYLPLLTEGTLEKRTLTNEEGEGRIMGERMGEVSLWSGNKSNLIKGELAFLKLKV